MNRCFVCFGLLGGLILICICSLLVIRSECRQFSSLTEAVSEAVEADNTSEALERFDTLNAEWEHFHNICGLFVNGEKLDPILEALSELRPLIMQEHPEAVSSLERLERLIEGVYEEEFPAFWHIL